MLDKPENYPTDELGYEWKWCYPTVCPIPWWVFNPAKGSILWEV